MARWNRICPLWHAAGTKTLALDLQLLLYALNQQASLGPNNTPKPWGWGVESTKWQVRHVLVDGGRRVCCQMCHSDRGTRR